MYYTRRAEAIFSIQSAANEQRVAFDVEVFLLYTLTQQAFIKKSENGNIIQINDERLTGGL